MNWMRIQACGLLLPVALAMISCGGSHSNSQFSPETVDEAKVVNLYIWADYLAPDTLTTFTKRTGIKVNVTYYDTLAVSETRVMSGSTGFDVVVTGPPFLRRLIVAGAFQPLDKKQLPNSAALDPLLMAKLTADDPGNAYGVIYAWGTMGLIYNEKMLAEALPRTAINNWSLFFDPTYAARLASCHFNIVDTPSAVIPIALSFLRRDVRNPSPQDLNDVANLLGSIRPYIHNIDSAGNIEAMANGDICMVVDSNGDAFQARRRAREAHNGIKINYAIPEGGSLLWFDMLTIPHDAPHVTNAHRLINFLLDPQVSANFTNFIGVANANTAALPMIDPAVRADPIVYPAPAVLGQLSPWPEYSPQTTRAITRIWQKFKTGQ